MGADVGQRFPADHVWLTVQLHYCRQITHPPLDGAFPSAFQSKTQSALDEGGAIDLMALSTVLASLPILEDADPRFLVGPIFAPRNATTMTFYEMKGAAIYSGKQDVVRNRLLNLHCYRLGMSIRPDFRRERRQRPVPPFRFQRQALRGFGTLVVGAAALVFVGVFYSDRVPSAVNSAVQFSHDMGREHRPEAGAYYRNCSEARAAGVAPLYEGEPGYRPEMDGDNDGVACEPYRGM